MLPIAVLLLNVAVTLLSLLVFYQKKQIKLIMKALKLLLTEREK